MNAGNDDYPPIGDYALIGDCHSAALVSRSGSIDWCCMPRLDRGSVFGRVLDWAHGGYCAIHPTSAAEVSRSYVGDTMVLRTVFRTERGDAHLFDCFTARPGGASDPYRQLLRVVEVVQGEVELQVDVVARFDYAGMKPWLIRDDDTRWAAMGGDDAIVIVGDVALHAEGRHDLHGVVTLRAGERARLSITAYRPEELDPARPQPPSDGELDARLDATIAWWRERAAHADPPSFATGAVRRSALVLKALVHAPTGAIAAAPTTSLPEAIGGPRNWDYRYSWIRDSQFTVRALAELGLDAEADGFRRFIERTAAGSVADLQTLYGIGGERRLTELTLPLEGYRGSAPVRVGNAAHLQSQHDVYGELLDLAWRWHQRGRSPDEHYWRFLVDLVDVTAAVWDRPDQGLWEMRSEPRHFVHSKVMCWAALDRGIALAEDTGMPAPLKVWRRCRDEIRSSIDMHGVDADRNVFVQAYDRPELDAALLLIPSVGFVAYDDPRMLATVDAIRDELDHDGLLRRYHADTVDGLDGTEGTFVACTFWLAECLAFQGRLDEARAAFDRATATANDVGLFAEEYDPRNQVMLGNFPQGLSHLSHIAAAVAIATPSRGGRQDDDAS